MQLTLFTDYSLRVLMYLSENQDRLCTVKEISARYGISNNHIVKVVHKLAQLGYIQSQKGKGGGIAILKKPEDINLRDLVIDLEPGLTIVECFDSSTNTCKIVSACRLKGILAEALKAFLSTLARYTLADTRGESLSDLLEKQSTSL
ncbi:MAG: Rrf2 family transcriptional regulator [Alphaproteobacteria bacterium]|nr:Rrf2 family transcriptional regulator [Alphaproteobacteria bacterium]